MPQESTQLSSRQEAFTLDITLDMRGTQCLASISTKD